MESIEISAKSEEEAVDVALAELGLSRSEVEVVVVKKGRTGIFGLGAEEVRVRVTPIEPSGDGTADVGIMARGVLEEILSLIDADATVNLESDKSDNHENQGRVILDIRGDDLGILIGRRGETISALQYLVNLIISRRLKAGVGIVVDVEGYRRRRNESLRLLAHRLANQVKSTGRSVTLEPMAASERRVIHMQLRDDPYVTTQSIGQGDDRKVVIVSRRNSRYSRA